MSLAAVGVDGTARGQLRHHVPLLQRAVGQALRATRQAGAGTPLRAAVGTVQGLELTKVITVTLITHI